MNTRQPVLKPVSNPNQPTQVPVVSPKSPFPWLIIFLLLIFVATAAVLGTYFFMKKNPSPLPPGEKTPSQVTTNPKPSIVVITNPPVTGVITNVPPTQAQACDVSDNSFCQVVSDLKSGLKTADYKAFLVHQSLQSVTCDPEGMYVAICEGVGKGETKEGYVIGYNQSEGTFVTQNSYVTSVASYVNSHGPFSYHGSIVSGDKGVAVFLNPAKDYLLTFPMKKLLSGVWKIDHLLVGGVFDDPSFINLSKSLLDRVP